MFDVGFSELIVIFVVALIVVGPERMPGLVRSAGQWLGRMQRIARELRAEFEREAHTQEFRALNREFQEEDRRLKELARSAQPLAADPEPPRKALADYTEEDFLPDEPEDRVPVRGAAATTADAPAAKTQPPAA